MIHREKVLGTINFECRQLGRFSEKDARVAEAFTQEIAKAVHRVWIDTDKKRREHRRKTVRTTTENYYEILKVVHEGTGVLNRIVYRTAISWRRGKEMINNLVSQGYLTKEKISAARYIYKITDKGIQAIDEYAYAPRCLDI
jgi:predicted transcriptional regulator